MKKYLMEYESFDRIFISEEELDLVKKMDCKNITIYELVDISFKKDIQEIRNGKKVFLCKNNIAELKELKDIAPIYINTITYDNNYKYYSYITADNKEEALKIFNKKLKTIDISKDIDECVNSNLNKSFSYKEIKIEDKHPERTKIEKKKSEEILKLLRKMS